MRRRFVFVLLALVWALAGVPTPARAQWFVASYTGSNFTRPADVTIDQPAIDRTLTFEHVQFAAEPFKSPQYYGARIGYLFAARRLGLEIEFLHQKVISRTERDVHVVGRQGDAAVDLTQPMNAIVQRYAMTHGLNFFLANLVWRQPLGDQSGAHPLALTLRGGAGPVMPGVDTVVGRRSVQHYQYAGLGGAASAGLEIRLWPVVSLSAEYKFTAARPRIDVDGGTGRTTTVAHHVAAGFVIRR
jgi:hypothetical protein